MDQSVVVADSRCVAENIWQLQGGHEEQRSFVDAIATQTSETDDMEISSTNPRRLTERLQSMLDTRVNILDPMYVCYASDQIDGTEMHRLDLKKAK